MDVFVARQPIFDREKNLFAYELLFRTGESNAFPDVDGDEATTSLLTTSFFTMGIESITGGKLAFVNFTEKHVLNGTPHLFPKEMLMVEILEDIDPHKKIIAACEKLKEDGYLLALDDFIYNKSFDELIELSDIVKIDFRLTSMEKIDEMVQILHKKNCRLLAEKIETYEEYEKALAQGFELFQGYFFSKPEVLKEKDLSAAQITMLQLLSKVSTEEFDIDELEKVVHQDVSISYKLISYLNSAHFSRVQPISSIRQAISYLGEKGFKLFVSLIVTGNLSPEKPLELMRLSIIRAKFLELAAQENGKNSDEYFLLGLFSCIDAMLDKDIKMILEKMPLSDRISEALVENKGEMYPYLRLIETYESGNWVAFQYALKRTGLTEGNISAFYMEALQWADSFERSVEA